MFNPVNELKHKRANPLNVIYPSTSTVEPRHMEVNLIRCIVLTRGRDGHLATSTVSTVPDKGSLIRDRRLHERSSTGSGDISCALNSHWIGYPDNCTNLEICRESQFPAIIQVLLYHKFLINRNATRIVCVS